MSGIGGWIDFENSVYSEDKSMALMLKTLKSRGTGETGKACIWKTNECYFLNHTLINRSGKEYIITCDGQLYNAGDVRLKLIKLGYSFDGYSDEEIILVAYIEWGADCLHEFNGTFAFAIWDSGKNELFIARDRVGVKPLFFYKYEHGLIFGSEIKSLLSHEWVPREINAEGIASLMLLGPARKCGFAVFKGIDEIQPGCFGVFSRGGFDTCRYWHIKAERHNESFEETSEHLRMLIIDSVERQLCSETPVCSLLSGGLDSSIITVIAAANLKTHGKQLSTYSVDYKDNNKNFKSSAFQPDEDAPWIEEMSRFAGTLQKNIIIDTDELSNALYDAVEARDLPGMADVDSSLYLFLKAVGNDFKIGLSGECADEILGGYPWYHNDEILFDSGFPWSRSVKERSALLKSGVLGDINAREYVDLACRETIRATDYLGNDTRKEHRIREMFMLNFYWFMQTLIDSKDINVNAL